MAEARATDGVRVGQRATTKARNCGAGRRSACDQDTAFSAWYAGQQQAAKTGECTGGARQGAAGVGQAAAASTGLAGLAALEQ